MVFRNEEGRFHHIGAKAGEVNPYVLLPGSRVRVRKIAEMFESKKVVWDGRFLMINGFYEGKPVTAIDTGIGPSSAAIVVREVIEGIDFNKHENAVLLRVGTSGSLQRFVKPGDLVVTTGAVAEERVSERIVGSKYPLCADPDVVIALVRAAEKNGYELGKNLHVGVTHAKEALYEIEDPSFSAFPKRAQENLKLLEKLGVLCTEMEFSIISALAASYNARWICKGERKRIYVGGIFLVLSPPKGVEEGIEFLKPSQEGLIKTALDALLEMEFRFPR